MTEEFNIKTVREICNQLDAMSATISAIIARGSKGEGALSQMVIKLVEAKQWGLTGLSTIYTIDKEDTKKEDKKKQNG